MPDLVRTIEDRFSCNKAHVEIKLYKPISDFPSGGFRGGSRGSLEPPFAAKLFHIFSWGISINFV